MTNEVHPKDRTYTFLGKKESVKVDFSTIIEDYPESNSIFSCKKYSTGTFDECAYEEVWLGQVIYH